jgi:hypothetical protein
MNAMEHEDAIRENAVQRYLLRKMTEDEREIFEEHYFDCFVCAADVTDGTRMMIAGQATVNVVPMPKRKPLLWPAVAAASLVLPLLGAGVGYRLASQRQHAPTELVRVTRLETGVSRAGVPAASPVLQPGDALQFDVEPSDDAVEYVAAVACGGKEEFTHRISRAEAADAVTLRLGELPASRCELVVQGVRKDGKRFRITSSPFEVGER